VEIGGEREGFGGEEREREGLEGERERWMMAQATA
jgi:hypothetical protein